jgi:hypothetical protein
MISPSKHPVRMFPSPSMPSRTPRWMTT